jgi:DNA recombination protein RmuC
MTFIYLILFILIAIILALAGFILSLRKKMDESEKDESKEKDDRIVSNLTNQIQLLSQSMGTIQKSVDQRLGENTNRLDNAARSYGEVQKQLTQLQEQTNRVFEISKDVSRLHEILKPPKIRGIYGESYLEQILESILSREHYDLQYPFKSGEKVDAIVRVGENIIPIDAKFPLENYKKINEKSVDAETESSKKQFGLDVKKHINSIAEKYIKPGEGTIDYALMFIPAENVFNEIIMYDFGNLNLSQYSVGKKVIPVSPNTIHAYLQTIRMGLRGMKIEKNAKVILQNLKKLDIEFGKVRKDFESLGQHLRNAQSKYESTDKRISRFESHLDKSRDKELEEISEVKELGESENNNIS